MSATENKGLVGLEKSLEELEALVARLEGGDLPLEQALKEFERGVRLTRQCQAALQEAEQKVEILLKKTEAAESQPFEPGSAGSDPKGSDPNFSRELGSDPKGVRPFSDLTRDSGLGVGGDALEALDERAQRTPC